MVLSDPMLFYVVAMTGRSKHEHRKMHIPYSICSIFSLCGSSRHSPDSVEDSLEGDVLKVCSIANPRG